MKRLILLFIIATNSAFIFGQITLVYERTTVKNTATGAWVGVNVPRSVPTLFTYKNNSITSSNSSGYMLQAGDEAPLSTNNNLNGAVITGNKFHWNGVNNSSILTHGLFAGYNINSVVRYNYLENVPYGIIFKSGTNAGVNMTFTSGGCAYNIWKNGKFGGRVKGINGVKFYNNTFYSGDGSGWYLLLITENMDRTVPAPSTGTKVFNNIFYSTIQIPMIKIESGSLTNFESDYNVYWCSAGEPTFNIDGATISWAQWKARGYDTHSVIVNPDFINSTDLIPRARLDYGKNLGIEWQSGLSTTATWVAGSSPITTNQNGTWQVGARIYESGTTSLSYINSVVENATPSIVEMAYNLSLESIVPATTAFNVQVNSVDRIVNSVTIEGSKVSLTLSSPIEAGNTLNVTYTNPVTNPLQTTDGRMAANISAQTIINNVINPPNEAPVAIKMTISPNHINKIMNILLEYSDSILTQTDTISPEIIKVFDLSGKLYIEQLIGTGVTNMKIPINLMSGIYIVSLTAGGRKITSQKMIVY